MSKYSLRNILKKLPLDLGQKEMRHLTMGSQIAIELAGEGGGRVVLDLGCGEGFWSEELKKRGWHVKSIDIKTDYSGAMLYDLNNGIPIHDKSVDLIFAVSVINYIKDSSRFRSEIKRILKKNGRFIVASPNPNFWADYLLKPFGKSLRDLQDTNQEHFWGGKELTRLFPTSTLYGYFPYLLLKFRISKLVEFLSPTFVLLGKAENL